MRPASRQGPSLGKSDLRIPQVSPFFRRLNREAGKVRETERAFGSPLVAATKGRFRGFVGNREIDPPQTSEPRVAGSSPAGRTSVGDPVAERGPKGSRRRTAACRFKSCRAYFSWRSSGGARPEGIATPDGSLQVQVLPGVFEPGVLKLAIPRVEWPGPCWPPRNSAP
jgi:hypothetical protein